MRMCQMESKLDLLKRIVKDIDSTQMRMCQMESKLDSLKKTVEDIDYVICRPWGCECVGSLKHQVKNCGLPK